MKRLSLLPIILLTLVFGSTAPLAAQEEPPDLSVLSPGGFQEITQDLNVNVVFIGYEPGSGVRDLDENAFLDELPESYRPINHIPSLYNENEFLGLTFNYSYNLVYANPAFEDDFFEYLDGIAKPRSLTRYQEWYNEQLNGELDVSENYWIDAPSVEQWLADNAGQIGVDTNQYTVFFINWYDRPDFKFHVYTKVDEPDPDTDVNKGEVEHSKKLIAWGGTTPDDEESGLGSLHRIWFYDLSAGPEGWTDNWNVDDADLTGTGNTDYRMPPVWEYGTNGYRPFDNLSGDLGKVTRYVAIDLLFTTSPLYKPAISPPELPEAINLDINVFNFDPEDDGANYFDTDLIAAEVSEVQPLNSFTADLHSYTVDNRLEETFLCFYGYFGGGDSCYGQRLFNFAFGDLFLYFNDHLFQYIQGDGDYELPIFAFNTPQSLFTGLLGFADDNYVDGTQSFVYVFDTPFLRDVWGYGYSGTTIHEVGHHLGLHHPHDGYDYEDDLHITAPVDDFYFVWSGDQSNTAMSYIELNWDFSQFDRDNMARFLTSTYLNQANVILADIYASPRAWSSADLLRSADDHAAAALAAYQEMAYQDAAANARLAYGDVLAAAAKINVPVEPQAWQADYKAKGISSMFVDELDYQRRKR